MNRKHIIALDTHCTSTEIGVMTASGRMVQRRRCPTKLSSLVEAIEAVPGTREVVLEEGPLADWILRGLTGHAERVTVCNPRRNHLIAKESDKSDAIDVEKLAHLYRGGSSSRCIIRNPSSGWCSSVTWRCTTMASPGGCGRPIESSPSFGITAS